MHKTTTIDIANTKQQPLYAFTQNKAVIDIT